LDLNRQVVDLLGQGVLVREVLVLRVDCHPDLQILLMVVLHLGVLHWGVLHWGVLIVLLQEWSID